MALAAYDRSRKRLGAIDLTQMDSLDRIKERTSADDSSQSSGETKNTLPADRPPRILSPAQSIPLLRRINAQPYDPTSPGTSCVFFASAQRGAYIAVCVQPQEDGYRWKSEKLKLFSQIFKTNNPHGCFSEQKRFVL